MLEKIRELSFYESGIEKIVIPKGVEEIQDRAFEYCRNLRKVVFEEGSVLKKIGNVAFCNCTNLKNVQLPDGLETIGICCFEDSGLEEIIFPASVKSIEPQACWRCR